MKGKKFLAFASIFAGVALVGSTFALWAVTDNADPFSIKVSPGKIASESGVKRVTLSYGDRVYTDVGEIVNGTKRLAAEVELKAEWAVDTEYPTFSGQFTIDLAQTKSTSPKLIDYLDVYVTSTKPTVNQTNGQITSEVTADIGSLLHSKTSHSAEISVTLPTPTGNVASKKVYVVVEYISADGSVVDKLAEDEVSISLDWKKEGEDVTSSYTIYYAGEVTDPRVYAWNQAETVKNKPWPGEKMTKVRDGLYSYELTKNIYYGFLLVNGATEGKITTNDVIISGEGNWEETYYDDNKPCFNGTAWTAIPEEPKYYVVGSFNMSGQDWVLADENYRMTPVGNDGNYVLEGLALAKNAELKVYSPNVEPHWWGDADFEDWAAMAAISHIGEGGNLVIDVAGTYDVTWYSSGTSGNYIGLATHSAA